MIRADFDGLADLPPNPTERLPAPLRKRARANPSTAKAPERPAFPAPAPVPSWTRPSGRAGEGEPLFAAGAGLALIDAHLRRDPPSAGALRSRLALKSAGACAKILRLNADEGALRDLRFAVGEDASPAARLLRLCRGLSQILRLNADEGALRDLRFAVGAELGPAAKLLTLWRDLAGRPPASIRTGFATWRRGWTSLCRTRTASHPA